jgi:basic membrane lipoprotein Med (substrate-binding protein (PBP1-ABC) superfamily)
MASKNLMKYISIIILATIILTACTTPVATTAPAVIEPTTAPAVIEPTTPPVVEPTAVPTIAPTTAPVVEAPKELRVAALLSSTADNPWDKSFMLSFERVQKAAPHGLVIQNLDYSDGVWGDEAEVVLREYAASGKYDIIWGNSAYSDQIKNLKDEFPEILWVIAGSGNEGLGGNVYYVFMHLHEVAYLMGRLAGALTESNIIGNIAGFPTDDANDVINGYAEGAKAVNPNIQVKVTFIESWYDPAKAADAAAAQIATGADQLYMNSFGFEPCVEAKVYCYATYEDLNYLAPSAVLTSALAYWDPHINYVIDEWWKHKTEGTPYNGTIEPVWFSMAQGTGDLAPFHDLESKIPEAVKADVMQAREDILSGKLVVPLNLNPITP